MSGKWHGRAEYGTGHDNRFPQWKQRIFESWERLLLSENRMDPVKQVDLQNVQGMVWELRREWLVRPAAESLSAYV